MNFQSRLKTQHQYNTLSKRRIQHNNSVVINPHVVGAPVGLLHDPPPDEYLIVFFVSIRLFAFVTRQEKATRRAMDQATDESDAID